MARPVVLLSYFELDDLKRLLDAIEPAGIPPQVPLYVGSYGVSREASGLIRSVGARTLCADVPRAAGHVLGATAGTGCP